MTSSTSLMIIAESRALSRIRAGVLLPSNARDVFSTSTKHLWIVRLVRRMVQAQCRPFQSLAPLCFLRVANRFRQFVLQHDNPRNEATEVVFDILAFLGESVSGIRALPHRNAHRSA